MNIGEAIELLKAGKAVRLKSWDRWEHIVLSEDGYFVNPESYRRVHAFSVTDFESDEWEEYVETYSFYQAIGRVGDGQTMRRLEWDDPHLAIKLNARGIVVIVDVDNYEDRYCLNKWDIEAEDWVVVE